jgi:hypothetical protein
MKAWMAALLTAALAMAPEAMAQSKKKAAPKKPPAAVVAPVAPPAPVTPAPPAMADPLAKTAESYAAFQIDVNELRNTRVANGPEVERLLDRVAGYNSDALTRGWIAYGALIAAQSTPFVTEVRNVAAAYGRDTAIRGFAFGGGYAKTLKGGDDAMRLAIASAVADGERVYDAGSRFKAHALELQKASWARTRVTGARPARVTRVRNLGLTPPMRPLPAGVPERLNITALSVSAGQDQTSIGGRLFWDALAAPPPAAGASATGATQTNFTPSVMWDANPANASAVDAMTSMAALYVLDALATMPKAQADEVLSPKGAIDCMKGAQMQFVQCVSTGEFHHENVACVGEAGLQTRALCLKNVATPRIGG